MAESDQSLGEVRTSYYVSIGPVFMLFFPSHFIVGFVLATAGTINSSPPTKEQHSKSRQRSPCHSRRTVAGCARRWVGPAAGDGAGQRFTEVACCFTATPTAYLPFRQQRSAPPLGLASSVDPRASLAAATAARWPSSTGDGGGG